MAQLGGDIISTMNKLLILAGLVMAIGICGCTHGSRGLSSDAPTVLVTVDEACQELIDNPVRAKDRFTQNRVLVTGTVHSIADDLGDDQLRVSFEGENSITFNFPDTPEMREKIGKVTPKTTATMEGVYEEEVNMHEINAITGKNQRKFVFRGVDLH